MRKFLLASVATLGTGGLMGAAFAQAPAAPVGAPSQGQVAYPLANPTAYVNDNNNYQAPALPGPLANPTPGTIVIHMNGKIQTTFQSEWGSVDTRTFAPPAAGSLNAVLGGNGTGTVKLNPYALDSFARLYFGADAMATNGLRYGAGLEIRENFTGQIGSNTSTNASGYTCTETLYVRRAFTYFAGENWGIVRLGQADGVIGIFDNGVTTGQALINGLNGGDNQNVSGAGVPFFFLATQGAEYGNTKVVYLSPQIAGFDFGVQWAPNFSNGYGIGTGNPVNASLSGAGIGTGLGCSSTGTSGCPNLASGPGILDGSKGTNQVVLGARYQGTFAGVGLLAYAAWEQSGHAHYTGLGTPLTAAGQTILGTTTVPGSTFNGQYDGLNFGSGGIAATFAGFTFSANAIGGRLNGQGALAPQGGAPEVAYILGLKYVTGPLTLDIQAEEAWYQGNVVLTGVSQRRARAITFGGTYNVAPGFQVFAEYLWEDTQQAQNNFLTGAVGTAAGASLNNNVKNQGFLIGNVINF